MKRVLSIDGGGIKGVFAASFLASVEQRLKNKSIGSYFDLIVGTSTGGIIALALGKGLSASEILEFYRRLGPNIFPTNNLWRWLRQITSAKYGHAALKASLESAFGDTTMADSKVRLVIPTASVESGNIYLYKTRHHPRLKTDHRERLVDVALATSAAPIFFPTATMGSGLPLVDGGLFANNPTAIATVEAITMLGWPREEVRVLSIGCTEEHPSRKGAGAPSGKGIVFWAPKIINFMLGTQSATAIGMAQHLVGHDNVVRINCSVPPGRFKMDDQAAIEPLCGLGAEVCRTEFHKLEEMFFSETAEPFVSIPL